MFEWSENFSVGIPLIDEQHKKLFSIGEKLHNMITEYSGDDFYDKIIELISQMKDYTIFHFNEEEKLLETCGYEGLEEHKIEHSNFIDYLENIDLEAIDGNQMEQMKVLTLFLAKWIFKHINNVDFRYSAYVKDKLSL